MPNTLKLLLVAQPHPQIAKLICETRALREQILVCCQELKAVSSNDVDGIRNLNDTIFGYRIELQSKLVKIGRMRHVRKRQN